ncbi:MAG: S41 family peptidase [Candidatus Pacebacteria bacterium]|nr:S41 family peptidase [Candidatus Paceibacterota bacterium]
MSKIFSKISFVLMIFLIIISFVAGYRSGENVEEKTVLNNIPEGIDFSIVNDVWDQLEEKYLGQLDHKQMVYGAAKGIAESLGDPYTVFYDPQESQVFQESISGAFEGLGMEVGVRDKVLTIIAPIKGSPAQSAGLLSGDKIIKIGDEFTSDMTIDEAVSKMRGKKDTKVVLTIFRDGWKDAKEFEIARAVINIPSVDIAMLDKNIAHLTIYQFNDNLTLQFINAANEIVNHEAKKIILDLRNNPGGLLDKAQEVAGWFLDKGALVLIEEYSDGLQKEYKAKGNSYFKDYPIIILVNRGTASGAEILAASLKENNTKVQLIGEKTFGKGLVQEALELEGNSFLKVTTAKWLTPNGNEINKIGITPDIEIQMPEDATSSDPQLDKAIELIKTY